MAIKSGQIIIIVAPSGTGKSTLLEMLFKDFPQLSWSISTTTRKKRPGEVDGEHYHFVSEEDFKAGLEQNCFVEWAKVHGNYYGVTKAEIERALKQGRHIVCDLDVQGADTILACYPDAARAIFIEPPSVEVLRQRLKSRATDETSVIELRIKNAEKELKRKNDYHYLVKNDQLDHAYQSLKAIFSELLQHD